MESLVFNIDCMEGMKQYSDKYFDLAVVDPPYGIGQSSFIGTTYKKETIKNKKGFANKKLYEKKQWDNSIPEDDYWSELFRVSKNQIVWGGNYFNLPISKAWIFWHKKIANSTTKNFADGELAWTSFDITVRYFVHDWVGLGGINNGRIDSIHPTQKPVALYSWIYKNYLPNGGKVIDTHLGSGSNRIAADKAGNIDFVGYELDKDYYEAQEKRWKNYKAQLKLFV